MIPVYQTMTVANDGEGNCFNACLASILERPLRDVAEILPTHQPYWTAWEHWLTAEGLTLDLRSSKSPPKGWSIAQGEGFRVYPEGHERAGKPIHHACVAFNGEVLHDPYPGGQGLRTIVSYWALATLRTVTEQGEG